jgi:hypothetical protein
VPVPEVLVLSVPLPMPLPEPLPMLEPDPEPEVELPMVSVPLALLCLRCFLVVVEESVEVELALGEPIESEELGDALLPGVVLGEAWVLGVEPLWSVELEEPL